MKKLTIRLLMIATITSMTFIRCGSSASLLSTGSSLFTALAGNSNLSTFVSLLQTPGLGKLLGSSLNGPITMLAPTNNALNALGSGVLSNLTKPENLGNLAGLLKKHIIPGTFDAATLMGGKSIQTAAGSVLNLKSSALGSLVSSGNVNVFSVDKVLE